MAFKSYIEEERCGFFPKGGTLDKLFTFFTLAEILEGAWEYNVCMVVLEKAQAQDISRTFCAECWPAPGLLLVPIPVCAIYLQDFVAQSRWGKITGWPDVMLSRSLTRTNDKEKDTSCSGILQPTPMSRVWLKWINPGGAGWSCWVSVSSESSRRNQRHVHL